MTPNQQKEIDEHNAAVEALGGWDAIVGGDPSLPPKGRDFDQQSIRLLLPDDDGETDAIEIYLNRINPVDSGRRVAATMDVVTPTLQFSVHDFNAKNLRLLGKFLISYAERMETL